MPARPRTHAGERLVSGGVLYDPIILVETIMHWYYLYESSPPSVTVFQLIMGIVQEEKFGLCTETKPLPSLFPPITKNC